MALEHLFATLYFPVELSACRFTPGSQLCAECCGTGKDGSLSSQGRKEKILRSSIALLADSLLLTARTRNREFVSCHGRRQRGRQALLAWDTWGDSLA